MKKIAFTTLLFFSLYAFCSTPSEILDYEYSLQQDLTTYKIESKKEKIFFLCTQYITNAIVTTEENIEIAQEMYDLMVSLEDVYSTVRGSNSTLPRSMVEGMVTAEENKIIDKYNDLVRESTKLKNSAKTDYNKYLLCPSEQQETFESTIDQAIMELEEDDIDGALKYLEMAKNMVYAKTEQFNYVMGFLNEARKIKQLLVKEEAEAKRIEEEKKEAEKLATHNALLDKKAETARIAAEKKLAAKKALADKKLLESDASDAEILGSIGIINKKDTVEEYNLDSLVLRQEVIGMAIKLAGITSPTEYTCKNIFGDVSAVKPNNWVCRAVEMGVERGIVSGANKNFNPESNITRAEALAILMNAAGIKTQQSTVSKYADVTVSWQINIVNTAFSYSFIDAATNFYPNKNATRGEIFNMAKRILKSKS